MISPFSVVMRCKNEERWIGHAIQSIIDHFPKNEIIIIDNNSTDSSLDIARSFKRDPALEGNGEMYTDVSVVQIDDYTPGKSLNLGVQHAKYENILILSAHCVIKNVDLVELISNLDEFHGVFGCQNPVYEGKKISKRYLWTHFGAEKVENMYSQSENRYFFHNALAAFKRSNLLETPFNEAVVGKEDRYWANTVISENRSTLYNPFAFEAEHHYTPNGNTWKGIG